MDFQKLLNKYDYELPAKLIAKKPASPRDSARLLAYSKSAGTINYDIFAHIDRYLPPRSVLVFNKTKVLPARLTVTKATGGAAHILYIGRQGSRIEVLSDRKLTIGSIVRVNKQISFVVEDQNESHYFLKPSFSIEKLFVILERYGSTPIPPYIKGSPLSEKQLRKEYQTVFAEANGSVAAPTAALHFTKPLLARLRKAGHEIVFVTLHVNLGTFAPLTEAHVKTGKLHEELFNVDARTRRVLVSARKQGRPIIAVGTTSVRALESMDSRRTTTDLFIRPGYRFKHVDGLITNFHVPRSSLLMLVSALVGREKLLELYQSAIRKKFKFFSFGDGMLIL